MSIVEKIAQQVAEGTIQSTMEETLEGYTAYAIAKILNETFRAVGITRIVQPQYIYNLAKSGKVDGVKGSMEGRRFSEEQVEVFVAKMVAQNLPK